ncbi:glycosyl hydrolase-related protein [Candidatus Bipolaricaulota bacterium]|nr:glycosyl hydrolase-related protein [Candidatus Bipolaricaulota bacterium]
MDQDKTSCDVIVVSHTHWDREWYLTFEEFRYRLVQAMDGLLQIFQEQPDYLFMLDGQVIPLLDYLAIRPEKEAELRELVRAGRLLIGPWYIQPDEFLASGEALIRNLMLGHRLAQRFGGVMKDGYVPDCFGHIAQLPQILRGFGIDTAFLTRGADLATEGAGHSEFLWQAPDGSRVLAHVMEAGYCAGALLTPNLHAPSTLHQELIQRELLGQDEPPLVTLFRFFQARSSAGVVLIPNGCDHLAPQPDILEVLRALNEQVPGVHLRQGTLAEFAQLVRDASPDLAVIEGELRAGRRHPILSGVYSARMYLKQRNAALETLLERYAEPLAAFAHLLGRDFTPFLWAAWELVLQNQAHDSICGTSVDPVHREMLVRYQRAEAIARQVIGDALRTIGEQMAAPPAPETGIPILVFNPCPWPRREEVVVEVEPSPEGKKSRPEEGNPNQASWTLLDPAGQAVPFAVLGERLGSEGVLQGARHVRKLLLAFQADLPPLGIKLYRLVPGKAPEEKPDSPVVDEHTLENEFYRVWVGPDGTISVLDKEIGRTYRGLCFLEDSGDAGDEYNYSPPARQEVITSQGGKAKVRVAERLPWKGTLRVDLVLRLPQGLTEDRLARSPERVDCPVTLLVSLQRGVKRVDVAIEVENNARDHRLRVGFPLGFRAEHSFAEDAFWVIRRPIRPPAGEGWVEAPPTTHPQKSFLAVEEGEGGLAVLNRGLPEYEVTEEGTIFVTLLRGVGWLSRDDLTTRRDHAGPPYETPEAQCLGRHRFELSLCPYRGTWEEARVWEAAHAFRAPPLGVQLKGLGQGDIPEEVSFLSVEPAGLVVSAVKVAEQGDGIIVRLYNPTRRPLAGEIRIPWEVNQAELVDLNEEPQGAIAATSPHAVPISVGSGEIKTVKLSPAAWRSGDRSRPD